MAPRWGSWGVWGGRAVSTPPPYTSYPPYPAGPRFCSILTSRADGGAASGTNWNLLAPRNKLAPPLFVSLSGLLSRDSTNVLGAYCLLAT